MSDEEEAPDEEPAEERVGYGRPPKKHQFKKGQSGNPRGRPKKKRKQSSVLASELRMAERILSASRRPVSVRENGEVEEIPTVDAVIRSLGVSALKGHHRAQVAYANLVKLAEDTIVRDWENQVDSVIEYQRGWRENFEHCDLRRQPRPEPVPHPDEILLDHDRRLIIYNGPRDDAEKAHWDKVFKRRASAKREIRECRADIEEEPELTEILEDEILWARVTITIVDGLYPDPETRRSPGFDIRLWRRRKGVGTVR